MSGEKQDEAVGILKDKLVLIWLKTVYECLYICVRVGGRELEGDIHICVCV